MTGCEAMLGLALFACLARNPACLPVEYERYRDDLAGIAEQESRWSPLAIRDETTKESLFPATRADAVREVNRRIAAKHTLGIGMFQITGKANREYHDVTPIELLNPCKSMRAGARHFAENVRDAAYQRYNSGRSNGAPAYAASVTARVERLRPLLAIAYAETPVPIVFPPPAPMRVAYGRSTSGRELVYGRRQ